MRTDQPTWWNGHAGFEPLNMQLPAFNPEVLQAFDPFYKGAIRCQLEAMTFWSRRAQAYMEIPARLSQCRTPQDVFNEQMRFWQTAFQQYNESAGRMANAYRQMATPPNFASTQPAQRKRDYMSFPEVNEPQRPSATVHPAPGAARRVA